MNNNMQQQTTINIQEKANLIWAIADKLSLIHISEPTRPY